MLLEIPYPQISPTLIAFGPVRIRWYALMYVAGYAIGSVILQRRVRKGLLTIPLVDVDTFAIYLFGGMLLGARLFYATVYQPAIWTRSPLEIFAVWHGGLSFHGAMLGMAVACVVFAKRHQIPFAMAADALAYAAPPGLLLGRIGNFINAELYGRPTDVPWAMRFPTDPEHLLRHPSQLYESLFEGLVLGFALWTLQRVTLRHGTYRLGSLAGAFLLLYGTGRFFLEYTRQPDAQLGLLTATLSMGQWLCVAMIMAGTVWLLRVRRRAPFVP